MAKQKGIFKGTGTLDDVTFYESQDGFRMRKKSRLNADAIKNSPSFQRTRENNSEFGEAGKAGKLIREAFNSLLLNAKDNRAISRLLQQLLKVIHTDGISSRGSRKVQN